MFEYLLVVHLVICVVLIGAILLQRSEGGGALGIGGGPSGLMSGRSAANLMTRTTAILGVLFFITSLSLTMISTSNKNSGGSLMQEGRDKAGIPTDKIDLSVPAAPKLDAPAKGGIPQSEAAPQTGGLLGATAPIGAAPAAATTTNAVKETK